MILRPATAQDAAALAEVHARAFDAPWDAPWDAEAIETLMGMPGGFAVVAETDGRAGGFILCRSVAGEAEILTLAVIPQARRGGVGRALVEAAAGLAAGSARSLFLEVAADNAAAIGLYLTAGFEAVGRRAGYYQRAGAAAQDALVLRRSLNSAAAAPYHSR
jgi:ribosomal-protein-alanine N-acetyltransferase